MNIQAIFQKELRKSKPLSKSDEQELLRQAQDGNHQAREKIITANLRFVYSTALEYKGATIPVLDLIQDGVLGLDHAINEFQIDRDLKFITYAVWWIKAYITKSLNEQGSLIRIPANQHLRIRQSLKEFSTGLEVPGDVQEFINLSSSGTSFDKKLKSDSTTTYGEIIEDSSADKPDHVVDPFAVETLSSKVLDNLPDREREIMKGLHGINEAKPLTLREIAKNMEMSHERVRQLRDQAIRRIKRLDGIDYLVETYKQLEIEE